MDRRVYFADVSSLQDDFQRLLSQIPPYRQRKIEHLRLEKDRCLSLGAGLLLQRALRDAGFDGRDAEPVLGENGKPFFPDLPEFHYNLSHSGTQVLCAVSPTEVGCDVETLGEYTELLAKRFFHPEEYAALCALSSADAQAEMFYRLWTLKESFIKATGRGLSLPLNEFSVMISDDRTALHQTADPRQFGLYELTAAPQYKAACCISEDDGRTPPELVCVDVSSGDL